VPQKNKPRWRTKKQDGGRKQKRKAKKGGEKEKGGKKCHQTNYPGYVNNQVSSALKRFRLERFLLLAGGGGGAVFSSGIMAQAYVLPQPK
jgi:hypothetical protein